MVARTVTDEEVICDIAGRFTPEQIRRKQSEVLARAAKTTDRAVGMALLSVATHTLELARLRSEHRIWANEVWADAASH